MIAEIFGIDGVVLVVVLLAVLFGSSQIPKLARSLGSAQSEFKKGHSDATDTPAATGIPAAAAIASPVVVPVAVPVQAQAGAPVTQPVTVATEPLVVAPVAVPGSPG